MSKKNSNVILKNSFKDYSELSNIYSCFEKKLISFKKRNFLVAVSGGPDSLALAALVKSFNYNNSCKVYYVLVDHRIRKNSSKEANSVKKLLRKYKITLNILKNKKLIKKNIQGEARAIRYDLLTNFCKKKKINIILTAHNLEDQVETFFIRLSRGSGLQGLSSMRQINKIKGNINLVRPLLDLKKIQLIKISKLIFNKYFKDPSNKNTKYLRTRIRNLKKTLEVSGINYDKISQSINNLASSRDTLEHYFNNTYKDLVSKKKGVTIIDLEKFNKTKKEMQIMVLKKTIKEQSNSYYSVRSKKIDNLINQIEAPKNSKSTLGGCVILCEKKHIILKKENKRSLFS